MFSRRIIIYATAAAAVVFSTHCTDAGVPRAHAQIAQVKASQTIQAQSLYGRFILQKQSYNRLWYVHPVTRERYYIKDDADLQWLLSRFEARVSEQDFVQIFASANTTTPAHVLKKYAGLFLATDSARGWYLNPADGKRYELTTYAAAVKFAQSHGLSADNATLRKIKMNAEQITFDAAFPSVAHAAYNGDQWSRGYNADVILPLASLTKLMTALILMDLISDWDRTVTVNARALQYPKTIVGNDVTSEVDLREGDIVKLTDLWSAMLLSSSNQAAFLLVEASGVSQSDFVRRMNEKAASMKLKKTVFIEMSGLDAHNISTAREAAVVAHRAFSRYSIVEPTRRSEHSITVRGANGIDRTIRLQNRNISLQNFAPDASKTGYLVEAQRNAAVRKNGIIAIVLHASSMTERNAVLKRLLE